MMAEISFTQEEITQLVNVLTALKVKPKVDSPEDFISWMTQYISTGLDALKSKPETTEAPIQYIPKLPVFTGDIKGETPYDVCTKFNVLRMNIFIKVPYFKPLDNPLRENQREQS